MIKTLKDLQEYCLKDINESESDIFKRRHMMTSPGISQEETEELKKALPGIPKSYTDVIENFNLNGICVGYFTVSPFSYCQEGMVFNLIDGNDGEYLFYEYAQKYYLYLVGAQSDYGVFVATCDSPFDEGEIILIDDNIYTDKENEDLWICPFSKNFEEFLIIAGNLNQIHREIIANDSNYEEKKAEFLARLKDLEVDEKYYPAWLRVF